MKKVDRLLSHLRSMFPATPTFEQFIALWTTMDGLSRSLYLAFAECPELFGGADEYAQTVIGYLERMGLAGDRIDLATLVEELDTATL